MTVRITYTTQPAPISEARWEEAQECETGYWKDECKTPNKLMRDILDGHHFTAGLLDIRRDAWGPVTVLDIAGGPWPLGVDILSEYSVLDPADYSWFVVFDPMGNPHRPRPHTRIREKAEGWRGGTFDEVWGYNVLQHVVDPAEVMATARACSLKTIRWFDVTDTPIYPVHPHSISADWLRSEMSKDGFKIVRDIDGSRLVEGHRQKWVALVAERT